MSDRSESVYASAPFKFIVDGRPLYIHADLVSRHSKPLDRMINGHMAEAQRGYATLEDVDEGTFIRFIEWAYKGYYTAGEPSTVAEEVPDKAGSCTEVHLDPNEESRFSENPTWEGDAPVEEPAPPPAPAFAEVVEEIDDGWGSLNNTFGIKSKKIKSKAKVFSWDPSTSPMAKEDLMQSFVSRRPVERKNAIGVPAPRRNQSSSEVYSDVFLSHARLYVFAEKYDIKPLKMLALDELHATLAIYTLYPKRTGDIVDLLRYVYANTGEPRKKREDMRTLITQYVGCEMNNLAGDENFKDLMIEDGGAILGDFMRMVRTRVS